MSIRMTPRRRSWLLVLTGFAIALGANVANYHHHSWWLAVIATAGNFLVGWNGGRLIGRWLTRNSFPPPDPFPGEYAPWSATAQRGDYFILDEAGQRE